MAAIVASKVRKQRALQVLHQGQAGKELELSAGQEERLRNQLNKIPVGPNGVRQNVGKKKDDGFRPNREGMYEGAGGGGANVILYIGLGMVAIGLVITIVGLGDKGFRTLELKLIGPSLVGCGMFFALLRILFCTIPSCCSTCCRCCRNTEEAEKLIQKELKEEEKLKSIVNPVAPANPVNPVRPVNQVNIPRQSVRPAKYNGTAAEGIQRRSMEVRAVRPPPHYVSDSEDEDPGHKKSMRSSQMTQPLTRSNYTVPSRSTEENIDPDRLSASSDHSETEGSIVHDLSRLPNLLGSTKNLRTGEIILNAKKL